MKHELTYQETLAIVEKFMIDSGIRQYCVKVCKGACCCSCHDGPEVCRHHEGRRLICSIFICYALLCQFSEKERKKLTIIDAEICRIYSKTYRKLNPKVRLYDIPNFYFSAPPKKLLDYMLFPIQIIQEIESINIKKIKTIMVNLVARKTNVRREQKIWKQGR